MNRILALAAVAALAVVAAAAAPAARADGLSPDELLQQYQPVTLLDRFERFQPTRVDEFLAKAQTRVAAIAQEIVGID